MPYKVTVDDNFNSLVSDKDRYEFGEFTTYEEALENAKRIVNESLQWQYTPGMTSEKLYDRYTTFGEDPWIKAVSPAPNIEPHFSAWDYAKARCEEICRSPG